MEMPCLPQTYTERLHHFHLFDVLLPLATAASLLHGLTETCACEKASITGRSITAYVYHCKLAITWYYCYQHKGESRLLVRKHGTKSGCCLDFSMFPIYFFSAVQQVPPIRKLLFYLKPVCILGYRHNFWSEPAISRLNQLPQIGHRT